MNSWYKNYDKLIEKIAPDYRNTLDALVDNLPSSNRIVELGCGTGNLTKLLASKFPNTSIHSIDRNIKMLSKTREKTIDFPNVRLYDSEILDFSFLKDDVIVGSYIFHLIPKIQRYGLFKRITQKKVQSIFIADRVLHSNNESDNRSLYYFRIKNNIPKNIVQQIHSDNSNNELEQIEDQMKFFKNEGYIFSQLFKNPNHGFMTYSYNRIYKQ